MVKFGGVARGAGGFGARTGYGILSKLKWFFFFFFFSVMIINAVIISVQAGSIEPGVKDLGGRWLLSTEKLGEESNKIIDRGALYDSSNGAFKGLWGVLKSLYGISEAIFVIFIWLSVLKWIFLHIFLWDTSKQPVAYLFAIVFFIMLQMLFIMGFTDKSIMTPLHAFRDFGRSIPFIFSKATEIADKVTNSS